MPLSYREIIHLACVDAHAAGIDTTGMEALAGQKMRALLDTLSQNRDVAAARGVFYFNFDPTLISVINPNVLPGGGPYNLPSDYLRVEDDDVFYVLDGVPYKPIIGDLSDFDKLIQKQGVGNLPWLWCTDVSLDPPVAYVYPPPAGAYPVTVRYFRRMPEVLSPESSDAIPWFRDQDYLISALTARMMMTTDDTRQPLAYRQSKDQLKEHLKMEGDRGNRVTSVQFDRRVFGRGWANLPPSKLTGGF